MAIRVVIILGHLERLAGIRAHGAVANGRHFVEEHIHVGQHRVGAIGQAARTVTRRADLGQANRPG